MKSLWLLPEAELDLAEAQAWYATQRPALGREFLRAVDRCFGAIKRHPAAYGLVDQQMRRALLSRFPYAVFFEIGETELVVYAVFHCARDPRAWPRRRGA